MRYRPAIRARAKSTTLARRIAELPEDTSKRLKQVTRATQAEQLPPTVAV
jgi:hypothetical protein